MAGKTLHRDAELRFLQVTVTVECRWINALQCPQEQSGPNSSRKLSSYEVHTIYRNLLLLHSLCEGPCHCEPGTSSTSPFLETMSLRQLPCCQSLAFWSSASLRVPSAGSTEQHTRLSGAIPHRGPGHPAGCRTPQAFSRGLTVDTVVHGNYLETDSRRFSCSMEGQAMIWMSSGLNSSFNRAWNFW